jgi:hypothetical protein
MLRAHCARIAEIGFAHFQEAPTTRQQPQGGINKLARQRIEHHVHALPAGRGQKQSLKLRIARVGDVISRHPHRQQRSPFPRTRRRKHLSSQLLRQLHRSHPHPTGRRMDQHALACLQRSQILKAV